MACSAAAGGLGDRERQEVGRHTIAASGFVAGRSQVDRHDDPVVERVCHSRRLARKRWSAPHTVASTTSLRVPPSRFFTCLALARSTLSHSTRRCGPIGRLRRVAPGVRSPASSACAIALPAPLSRDQVAAGSRTAARTPRAARRPLRARRALSLTSKIETGRFGAGVQAGATTGGSSGLRLSSSVIRFMPEHRRPPCSGGPW